MRLRVCASTLASTLTSTSASVAAAGAVTAAAILMLSLARPAAAQHATADDITDGARAYGESCIVCHGPDGNLIAGIDFGRGQFRRDYSDAELVGIIMNGIPNTPMPPTPAMSAAQAERIVAFLRDMPARGETASIRGDAARGRAVYFGKGACSDCHAIGGEGARHGPDLSRIGRDRGVLELESALLAPAAVVQPTARSVRVTLAGGEVVTGRLLNHDSFTLQLIDTDDRLRSFVKSELRGYEFVATPMPSYIDTLTTAEIADLVSFLASLQGA